MTDPYKEYLKKCGCEGPLCAIKPKLRNAVAKSEVEKPKLRNDITEFISVTNNFSSRLKQLEKHLAKCGSKPVFPFTKDQDAEI